MSSEEVSSEEVNETKIESEKTDSEDNFESLSLAELVDKFESFLSNENTILLLKEALFVVSMAFVPGMFTFIVSSLY